MAALAVVGVPIPPVQQLAVLLRQDRVTTVGATGDLPPVLMLLVLAAVLAVRAGTLLHQSKAAPEEQDCHRPLPDLVLLGQAAVAAPCMEAARGALRRLAAVLAAAGLVHQAPPTRAAVAAAHLMETTAALAARAL